MTTFHDGPAPQSRRAARESERAASNTDQNAEYGEFVPPVAAASVDSASNETTDASREQQESARPAPGGRRAQRAEGGPDAVSPTYASQIPSYDGPSFSRTSAQSNERAAERADTSTDDASYRIRDFSPEGRRAAQVPSTQAAALDFRSQAEPASSDWQPPAAHEPAAELPDAQPAAQPDAQPAAQPLTRRERRAMEQQAEAAAAAADLVEPPEASASATALSNAIAEFEALTRVEYVQTGAIRLPPPVVTPVVTPADTSDETPVDTADETPDETADPFADLGLASNVAEQNTGDWGVVAPSSAEHPDAQSGVVPAGPIEPPEPLDAAQPAPFPFALHTSSNVFDVPVVEQAAVAEPAPVAEVEAMPPWARDSFEQVADEPSAIDDDVDEDPVGDSSFDEPQVVRESYTPPAGHWSRQAELDDEIPADTTLSREVGASNISTTTSALILPSIPQSDFSGLINGTGEILITGTIELPSSLGTMGADARHFDNPDVDHMFDAFDKELVSNDSQPVRAIRAVSTHTATRGVIQLNTKPQRSNRLITAGLIAAGVLVVGVVGLLVFYVIYHP